jgi:hypothetical protein
LNISEYIIPQAFFIVLSWTKSNLESKMIWKTRIKLILHSSPKQFSRLRFNHHYKMKMPPNRQSSKINNHSHSQSSWVMKDIKILQQVHLSRHLSPYLFRTSQVFLTLLMPWNWWIRVYSRERKDRWGLNNWAVWVQTHLI